MEIDIPGFFSRIINYIQTNTILVKQLGILSFIILCGLILYFASTNPAALTSDTYTYILYIFLALAFFLIFWIPTILNKSTIVQLIIMSTLAIGIIGLIVYSYIQFSSSSLNVINYMVTGIVLLAVLVGLAILVMMTGNYLKSQTGWVGFIVYFIFYIPCLLIDFVKYWMNEFKTTTNVIYYLFIIEIIIVLSYFYIPPLIQYILLKDGTTIIKSPMYLNTKQTVSPDISIQVKNPYKNDLTIQNEPIVYRTNYALSMWIFLNTQHSVSATNVLEIPIFDYGHGKPKITYSNKTGDPNAADKYNIYFTNAEAASSKYQITLPSQKWNQLVFNYTANHADLFINGLLTYTFEFVSNNLPTYSPDDVFDIGSTDGLDGSICNIKYYPDTLSKSQIANSYNLLLNKNPPVN